MIAITPYIEYPNIVVIVTACGMTTYSLTNRKYDTIRTNKNNKSFVMFSTFNFQLLLMVLC